MMEWDSDRAAARRQSLGGKTNFKNAEQKRHEQQRG
jgi:hypothetical protein